MRAKATKLITAMETMEECLSTKRVAIAENNQKALELQL
jgi:hypothetical protein